MVTVYVPDAADKPAPATTIIFLEPRRAFWNLAVESLMALLVWICARPHGVLIYVRYPGGRKCRCLLEVTLRPMTRVLGRGNRGGVQERNDWRIYIVRLYIKSK